MSMKRISTSVPLAGAVLLAAALATTAAAQTSANYKLEEHAWNAGGRPAAGATPASTSYRISLDALGEAAAGRDLSSASYGLDGGLVAAYPPPLEVLNLALLSDKETLTWNPEPSGGAYNLYRDLISALSGSNLGACEQQQIAAESTTDTDTPPAGDAYFYLVTAVNRLREEGTLGFDGSAAERPNNFECP